MNPYFSDKKKAAKAGQKGGKAGKKENRFFFKHPEKAAEAGRKSRYVAPKPKPQPDDTAPRALFEATSPEYAAMVPWKKLTEHTKNCWRLRAKEIQATQEPEIRSEDHLHPAP